MLGWHLVLVTHYYTAIYKQYLAKQLELVTLNTIFSVVVGCPCSLFGNMEVQRLLGESWSVVMDPQV